MNRKRFQELLDDRPYRFDAFVSYSAKKLKWVKTYMPQLEAKYNLRLCLHDRLAGRKGYRRKYRAQHRAQSKNNLDRVKRPCYISLVSL